MAMNEPGGSSPLEPTYSKEDREELAGLDFFLKKIEEFRPRGLIEETSLATIQAETHDRQQAITQRGRAETAIATARRIKGMDARGALKWLERGRVEDPSRVEAWTLGIELHRRLQEDEAALALAAEAVARFPDFALRPEQIREEIEERARAKAGAESQLADARAAIANGHDDEAIAITTKVLASHADEFEALVLQAFALQRQNRLTEALSLYRRIQRLEPRNETWTQWVSNVQRRLDQEPLAPRAKAKSPHTDAVELPSDAFVRVAEKVEPRVAWSSVAAEFLQDHWQKLILCLAVLLIVVSSNVGAAQVLGERLWTPVGKCLLALAYTGMFALFGAGLVRWGAERAGRIMLFTTLIVVPANFMLIGQMKLLTEPSTWRLAVLGVDAIALFLLIRLTVRSLYLVSGAWALTIGVFALSAFNATAAPGVPWPWEVQFGLFLCPAFLFLAWTAWIGARMEAELFEANQEIAYFSLALLTFAFLTGLIRTGVFALELIPTLWAVPVMVIAVSCVNVARGVSRFDPDPRRAHWLKLGGLVLSGMGIALAIARPPEISPLYSANTLAAALIGLGLYAALLWKERTPAYLYFACGALGVAYFGSFHYVREFTGSCWVAMGLPRRPPLPFRAINGLAFNTALAALSLTFSRKWDDARLARHCHYIGLPLAIGMCVLSGFHPRAALICMTGYTALFALGAWIFAQPFLLYLTAASMAGAAYFGSTLLPGVTLADQALGAACLALVQWLLGASIGWKQADSRYRGPLGQMSVALAIVAMFMAVGAVNSATMPLAAALALLTAASVPVLRNHHDPQQWLGYVTVIGVNVGLAFLAMWGLGRWSVPHAAVHYSLVAGAIGLGGVSIGNWLRRRERAQPSACLAVYPKPLFEGGMVQSALALTWAGIYFGRQFEHLVTADFALLAFALGLSGLAIAELIVAYPRIGVAHLALACGLGVWVCVFQVCTRAAVARFASYGAVVSVYSLWLLAVEESAALLAVRLRKSRDKEYVPAWIPGLHLFARALSWFEVGSVGLALGLCVAGIVNGPAVIFTLFASAVALLWSTRLRPVKDRVDAANLLAILGLWFLTGWLLGWVEPGKTFAWLALSSALAALVFWSVWRVCERIGLDLYAKPMAGASRVLTWLVFALAVIARVGAKEAYPIAVGALVLNGLALLLHAMGTRSPLFSYRAIAALVVAVYLILFSVGEPDPSKAYVLGLAAILQALACSTAGFLVRSRATTENGRDALYAGPLFHCALLLTLAGVLIAYRSPASMVLAGASFLLFVKGLPARQWLYATIGALGCGVYYSVVIYWTPPLVVSAMVALAFGLWIIGLGIRRIEPALRAWLRLPDTGYGYPLFNSAVVAGMLAVGIRVSETLHGALPWSASAGLTLTLAAFCVLMVKPYPVALWVDAAVALTSCSVGLWLYPYMTAEFWWLPLGMGLALAWMIVARGLPTLAGRMWAWFELPVIDFARHVGWWSIGLLAASASAVVVVVVGSLLITTLAGIAEVPQAGQAGPWSAVLLALALGSIHLWIAWGGTSFVLKGQSAALMLAVWWLAAPISPLVVRWGVSAARWLPLSTAAMALGAVIASSHLINRLSWIDRFRGLDDPEDTLPRQELFASRAGVALAILAAILTRGTSNPTNVTTLILAALAAGFAAHGRNWVAAAYVAGVLACGAAICAATEALRRVGIHAQADTLIGWAFGLLLVVAALLTAARNWRRGRAEADRGQTLNLPAPNVAAAFEQGAALTWIACALAIVLSTMTPSHPAGAAAIGAVGVLCGLTLAAVALIATWRFAWLVYPAHASLMGAYFYYRWAFPLPMTADAAILTLFGYLYLGLAEVMTRVGLGRYAAPTRYISLAVPILPLLLGMMGVWGPVTRFDDLHLFILLAVGTFYGTACYSLRWRSLGYAAAVLYNAFLWVLWSRIGWTLSDRPQFFLIPVGLSTVLFAEVNRRELGREAVNAIRGIGLMLVYVSLAVPIWQFQSLGSWATLLALSLVGIFVGIGLRVQVFLWMGLVMFVLDVVYQLFRVGTESALAKWAIMLTLGITLVVFVALNEKKRIVGKLMKYVEDARAWD